MAKSKEQKQLEAKFRIAKNKLNSAVDSINHYQKDVISGAIILLDEELGRRWRDLYDAHDQFIKFPNHLTDQVLTPEVDLVLEMGEASNQKHMLYEVMKLKNQSKAWVLPQ